MGYLTTITIYNDAMSEFEKDPQAFGEAIIKGIRAANRNGQEESASFKNFANYISVQPSRHADDQTVYLHSGNCLFNLNPYNLDFKRLEKTNLNLLKKFISIAEHIIKDGKKTIKSRMGRNIIAQKVG